METREMWTMMIRCLKKDVKPATGCTEPIALAYASAVAAKYLGEPIERIEAQVSANLMKNGMAVTVPGTGTPGLYIAASVSALGGDPEGGLQVLKKISTDTVFQGKQMVADGKVHITLADVPNVLYAEATVYGNGHSARVCIADEHTNIVSIEKDGASLYAAPSDAASTISEEEAFLHQIRMRDIYQFATEVPLEEIAFLEEAARMNEELSQVGMKEKYGHAIGYTMKREMDTGFLGHSLVDEVIMRTAAASDARMGGAPLPAMTNSGSGNQGIAATMPVVATADRVKASREQLIRALSLSHLTAIYVHSFLPKLSALCAAGTAAMGAAAGMVWLLGGKQKDVEYTIFNMTGDHIGMICDGAGNSCTLKVATACDAACRAALLALHNTRVSGDEGLVSNDVDESIRNIGQLASKGMVQTDTELLSIMLNKNQS